MIWWIIGGISYTLVGVIAAFLAYDFVVDSKKKKIRISGISFVVENKKKEIKHLHISLFLCVVLWPLLVIYIIGLRLLYGK